MGNDKETKSKLIESAKKEFMEKGYMKASLRDICKNAGVTTGAMYFVFKDKDDLFAAVVGEPLNKLKNIIESHMSEELGIIDKYEPGVKYNLQDDKEAAIQTVKILFRYKDEYELLITKSQGSSFENVIDDIADMLNNHYCKLFRAMKGYASKRQMTKEDKFIVHWMAHDQVDLFVHLLTHCKNEKDALAQLSGMLNYLIGGWFAVIGNHYLV